MAKQITMEEAERIYNEFSSYVFKTALFLTRSKDLSEDITQETFIKIFTKYSSFDTNRELKPWIYKITLNVTRNSMRRHKIFSDIGNLPEIVDEINVESIFEQSETSKSVFSSLNKLSLKFKEIIILRFYIGMKLTEIAKVLNIPVGTCKSRLHNALSVLRNDFKNKNINI